MPTRVRDVLTDFFKQANDEGILAQRVTYRKTDLSQLVQTYQDTRDITFNEAVMEALCHTLFVHETFRDIEFSVMTHVIKGLADKAGDEVWEAVTKEVGKMTIEELLGRDPESPPMPTNGEEPT